MDKKSIIGIILIFLILIIFSVINQPSKEKIEAAQKIRDSIARVEQERALSIQESEKLNEEQEIKIPLDSLMSDSLNLQNIIDEFGVFGLSTVGKEEFYIMENNLMKITFSTKGGRIISVELKGYKTHTGKPLILFEGSESLFGLNFFAQNRNIQTEHCFFKTDNQNNNIIITGPEIRNANEGIIRYNENNPGNSDSISFRLEVEPGRYIEYTYTMEHNSFMVGFDVNLQGMNRYIASNQSFINFAWSYDVPRQERASRFGEDRYTNITYKFFEDEVNSLSQVKSEEKDLTTRVNWIGFKQLFFSSTLIADEFFPSAHIRQTKFENNPDYLANFYADISIPYQGINTEKKEMQFYFGPNHYQTLKQYNLELERQVSLGYAVVRPVNKYIIIPIFNFLRKFISNFGIIIVLLTVFIKIILFPFTYKSYMSQAKMRVLKPEVDEINEKFGNSPDKAMEKQQAVMALYRKVGVNPLGGCLPMILQFPILLAMFFFFPASIELRQKSFLWAQDLSTYDSILNLPFEIPFYGSHVSLFCLLMTVTTIFYSRLNQQTASAQTMPGMKMMIYVMPIMLLFVLNSYPAGLSFYYFLANIITIGQTYLIRLFVDENKIRLQLHAKKRKPAKKSNFQKRMEDMAKQRGMQLPKK
ncbi:MAG: membrane protein insertase YidC [Bacteroidales bacterium]|jgi:YidC/Oxa1 family membrane protein insertase|nr:membrane protein insertase YidC [Bacteroidales bacterium]